MAVSRESGTLRSATITATMPTGTLTMKTRRHDACTSTPPTTGPMAAASAPAAAQMRTARTRRSGVVEASSSPRLVGVSAAAPAACSTRNATSIQSPVLSAQAALADVNSARLPTKPALRP